MNKLLIVFLLSMTVYSSFGQYRPYHQEDFTKNKKGAVDSFKLEVTPCIYKNDLQYSPQVFQGLQVISMNRPGGTFDDVYFIDKGGLTQYHTIKPTAPINTHSIQRGVYDSSNPWNNSDDQFGHALIEGVASIISMLAR